jgi:hypothetical protein
MGGASDLTCGRHRALLSRKVTDPLLPLLELALASSREEIQLRLPAMTPL